MAKFFRTNQPSMLDISFLEKDTAQRSMDFIFGALTTMQATATQVGDKLFLFAPKGTKIVGLKEDYEQICF